MSPFIFIIFGATGDLTRRKLMPAIFKLFDRGLIPAPHIIGVGRRELTSDQFSKDMHQVVSEHLGRDPGNSRWNEFSRSMRYVSGAFEDDLLYTKITDVLTTIDKEAQACIPRFFYLAAAPVHYDVILTHLKSSALSEGCGQGTINYTRVLIEKPFGRDLATAAALEQKLSTIFEEKQLYRIDHYLGKEAMQNILAFRFGNGMFEPTWNSQFIDHVQLTFAEELGVGSRGEFYDGIGALRDVVQNHMLQMVALIGMEQPRGFDSDAIRTMRNAAMQAIACIKADTLPDHVIRGQYIDGHGGGYRTEPGVKADSQTETFVALKIAIETPRWQGVPFYLRAGKRMAKKTSEVSIHYKIPPCPDDVCLFPPSMLSRNILTFQIEPDNGINLKLMTKEPGFGMSLMPSHMNIVKSAEDVAHGAVDAYERLLLDAIGGDQTLFARTDEIVTSWQFMTKIIEGWQTHEPPIFDYHTGSWGPDASDHLIEKDGRTWRTI